MELKWDSTEKTELTLVAFDSWKLSSGLEVLLPIFEGLVLGGWSCTRLVGTYAQYAGGEGFSAAT